MAGSKWDGKISNLNISEQAFPELYRELSQMQHKARSDRLAPLLYWVFILFDFLATLGLLSNRVQRVNLHSIKIRQCRLTQN